MTSVKGEVPVLK